MHTHGSHLMVLSLWYTLLACAVNISGMPNANLQVSIDVMAASLASSNARLLLQNCPSGCRECEAPFVCKACEKPLVPSTDKRRCACPAGKQGRACAPCAMNMYCPHGKGPINCPKNLITKRNGAKTVKECVTKAGYYYRPPTVSTQKDKLQASPDVQATVNLNQTENTTKINSLPDDIPVGLPCPPDTWSTGGGYEPYCTPCPSGFFTDPTTAPGTHTTIDVCMAPPGFFIDSSNKDNGLGTVLPCPVGQYRDTYNKEPDCIPCSNVTGPTGLLLGYGLTTAGAASNSSDECKMLEPGWVLVDDKGLVILGPLEASQVAARSTPCPQGFICPGGDPTTAAGAPRPCPRGMWTEADDFPEKGDDAVNQEASAGASSDEACVAPPGWILPDNGSEAIRECPTGTYKEGWNRESKCTLCGEGLWLSEPRNTLTAFNPSTGQTSAVAVRASPDSCFIQTGMGLQGGRAVICPPGFYGMPQKSYGVGRAASCIACKSNLWTSGSMNRATSYINLNGETVPISEEEGGYFSSLACLTKPGWGYDPYVAGGAVECRQGQWNAGGNLDLCKDCPIGTTTAGSGSINATDCSLFTPGWGQGQAGNRERCPAGTYSNGTGVVGITPCTKCPTGSTTRDTASTSAAACNLCAPGYGGSPPMACKPCMDGYYGPPSIRGEVTRCLMCPTGRSFRFAWETEDVFEPRPTSPVGATSSSNCLAEFSQTRDGPWFLPLIEGPEYKVVPGNENLASCVNYCSDQEDCAAITFDYSKLTCSVWMPGSSNSSAGGVISRRHARRGIVKRNSYEVTGGLAFKTELSANVAEDTFTPDVTRRNNMASSGNGTVTANNSSSSNGGKTKKKGMGSGYYSFWSNAAAASALGKGSLLNVAGVASLNQCMFQCSMDTQCAGIVFGPFTASTDTLLDIPSITPGIKCQKIRGVIIPGDPRRTLTKAKYTALTPI